MNSPVGLGDEAPTFRHFGDQIDVMLSGLLNLEIRRVLANFTMNLDMRSLLLRFLLS